MLIKFYTRPMGQSQSAVPSTMTLFFHLFAGVAPQFPPLENGIPIFATIKYNIYINTTYTKENHNLVIRP